MSLIGSRYLRISVTYPYFLIPWEERFSVRLIRQKKSYRYVLKKKNTFPRIKQVINFLVFFFPEGYLYYLSCGKKVLWEACGK